MLLTNIDMEDFKSKTNFVSENMHNNTFLLINTHRFLM